MVLKKKKILIKVMLYLSILSVIILSYLLENHYAAPISGSVCDFTENISCSIVNTSRFSEVFHVPIALLGIIWFLFLIYMCRKLNKEDHYIDAIFLWNVVGVIFVIYFIRAEMILKTLCPLCTVVHLIIAINLAISFIVYWIISFILYTEHSKVHRIRFSLSYFRTFFQRFRPLLIAFALVMIVAFAAFNILDAQQKIPPQQLDAFAQCITDKSINMYSSFRCTYCAKTKEMFGYSFEYINEVECHPQGPNSQYQRCNEKNIEGTPTWIMEPDGVEVKRRAGFLSLEELAQFSGCQL